MDAGLGAKRTAFDDVAFLGGQRVFVKLLGGKIPMDRSQVLEAEFLGAVSAVPQTRLFHASLRRTNPTSPACQSELLRRRSGSTGAGPIKTILLPAKTARRHKAQRETRMLATRLVRAQRR